MFTPGGTAPNWVVTLDQLNHQGQGQAHVATCSVGSTGLGGPKACSGPGLCHPHPHPASLGSQETDWPPGVLLSGPGAAQEGEVGAQQVPETDRSASLRRPTLATRTAPREGPRASGPAWPRPSRLRRESCCSTLRNAEPQRRRAEAAGDHSDGRPGTAQGQRAANLAPM